MQNYKLKRKLLSKIVANPNFIFRSQFWDDGYVYDNDMMIYLLHLLSILCVRLIAKLCINITSFNTNNNSNTLY